MPDAQTCPTTIVVLESSYPTRFLIRQVVNAQGLEVIFTDSVAKFFNGDPSGASGIAVEGASLFVIGHRLPDGDGLDVISRLKQMKPWSRVPIIMIDHEARRETLQSALALGVSDFLLKPFSESDLMGRLLNLLSSETLAPEEALPTVSHSLFDLLSKEVSRARRSKNVVSFMLVDFSGIPDEIGGSQAQRSTRSSQRLSELLEAVRHALRDIDTIVPYAGYSFAAVLPLTGAEGLPVVERRIREASQSMLREIEAAVGHPVELFAAGGTYPDDAEDWKALMDCARTRLDQASGHETTASALDTMETANSDVLPTDQLIETPAAA